MIFVARINLYGETHMSVFDHNARNLTGIDNIIRSVDSGYAAEGFADFSVVQLCRHS